jgi:hypothetical protein
MGSYVQVIVGGMLLVTAFLVGRHINDKPIIVTGGQDTHEMAPVNLQASTSKPAPSKMTDSNPSAMEQMEQNSDNIQHSDQRSLRDRILDERKKQVGGKLALKLPEINTDFPKPKPFTLSEADIVVPDFAKFDSPETLDVSPEYPRETASQENSSPIPRSDGNTLPANRDDGIVVGPVPSKRISEIAERKFSFPPQSTSEPIKSSSKVNRSLRTVRKKQTTIGQLVPVRHRESRITTDTQKFISYTTVFGDTLHGLSSRFFGKPDYYLDIYLANKELLENPSTVPVNKNLRIPVMAELIDQSPSKK